MTTESSTEPGLTGRTIFRAGSSAYEEARKVWNGTIDKRPGLIVRCHDAQGPPLGRSVPLGVFSETEVGGLTLSGGYGWQSRARGLSCDNLLAASVVTADGHRA